MDNGKAVKRLAALGRIEARLMGRLAKVQAERCELLCAGYTANARTLGLDEGVEPSLIERKD